MELAQSPNHPILSCKDFFLKDWGVRWTETKWLGWDTAHAVVLLLSPMLWGALLPRNLFLEEWWAQNGHSQVKYSHSTGLVTWNFCGGGESYPPLFSSFWVCNYFVWTPATKDSPYWNFFFILILPLVFILFNTFCISHFLIFHWLLSQVKAIYVTLYFLGKELCLTMLVFRERWEEYMSL